jgi:hypothetical protein
MGEYGNIGLASCSAVLEMMDNRELTHSRIDGEDKRHGLQDGRYARQGAGGAAENPCQQKH